jgi:hypothetical protein
MESVATAFSLQEGCPVKLETGCNCKAVLFSRLPGSLESKQSGSGSYNWQ